MRVTPTLLTWLLVLVADPPLAAWAEITPPPFENSHWFNEQTCTRLIEPHVRIHVNRPLDNASAAAQTRVLLYALPNGNTIEQTLGCKLSDGLDWHYDIQHVAAQVRLLRSVDANQRLILVCAEAGGLSWPAWRSAQEDANRRIAELVNDWRVDFGGEHAFVTLTGHSGGGSLLFGLIEASPEIPGWIDRIAFLDANYAFDADRHGNKLQQWLARDDSRRLIVVTYDDREIELEGKRVVGPDGGTFRATRRMRAALSTNFAFSETVRPPFTEYQALEGRIRIYVHDNPKNKILHTALVGEMNGLIHAQTLGTLAESTWGTFGGPPAYTRWIQPCPTPAEVTPRLAKQAALPVTQPPLPPRPVDAVGGLEFIRRIESMSPDQREADVYREITGGNFPTFLRNFKRVPIRGKTPNGKQITGVMDVMCDYLAVGSDDDFVRIPLRPQTAQKIADQLGCVLPTRKMVDAIDRHAELHLEPRPLTEDRESVATFVQHHRIIESQRAGQPLGALVTGIKKDVVLSPRIFERPNRLAIYGWRKRDGQPIQNLSIVHVNRYVDYSHGIRLVRQRVEIEGKSVGIQDLLQDENRCALVSDEGPMDSPRYPTGE